MMFDLTSRSICGGTAHDKDTDAWLSVYWNKHHVGSHQAELQVTLRCWWTSAPRYLNTNFHLTVYASRIKRIKLYRSSCGASFSHHTTTVETPKLVQLSNSTCDTPICTSSPPTKHDFVSSPVPNLDRHQPTKCYKLVRLHESIRFTYVD